MEPFMSLGFVGLIVIACMLIGMVKLPWPIKNYSSFPAEVRTRFWICLALIFIPLILYAVALFWAVATMY